MQPWHLPYLLNPGLCHVVLTYPETGPYMPFLSACAAEAMAKAHRLTALRSGFLQTTSREDALAFG